VGADVIAGTAMKGRASTGLGQTGRVHSPQTFLTGATDVIGPV